MRSPALPTMLLHALAERQRCRGQVQTFTTGLTAVDRLLPGGGFACGCIHELLSAPPYPPPISFASLLARCAAAGGGAVAWFDPEGEFYPPALAATGLLSGQILLLRPTSRTEALWTVAECCGCTGVAVTVANMDRLSRVEARRLQLAAERGGGIGLLLRPFGSISSHYAAATRWLVTPRPGDMAVRRWEVQLLHGHGGRIGQNIVLEVCRETNHVRAFETVADRPAAPKAAPIPA